MLDFLGEHPEFEDRAEEIYAHAAEIGQISNAFSDDDGYPDDDYPDDLPGGSAVE